jgi:hypothetical protein
MQLGSVFPLQIKFFQKLVKNALEIFCGADLIFNPYQDGVVIKVTHFFPNLNNYVLVFAKSKIKKKAVHHKIYLLHVLLRTIS